MRFFKIEGDTLTVTTPWFLNLNLPGNPVVRRLRGSCSPPTMEGMMEPLKAAASPPTSLWIHRALLRVAQAVDRAHQARTDSPQGLCPTCEALRALDLAYPKWRRAQMTRGDAYGRERGPPHDDLSLGGRSVLVVDDSRHVRAALTEMLEHY